MQKNTSARCAACSASAKISCGRNSPNHTTSGRTRPPQCSHFGGNHGIAHKSSAFNTVASLDIPMKLKNVLAARPAMKIVNILSNEREIWNHMFQSHQSLMTRVRGHLLHHFLAIRIPFPHQSRIADKSIKICQLFGFEFRPQSIVSTKGRYTTFCRNTRTCQNTD